MVYLKLTDVSSGYDSEVVIVKSINMYVGEGQIVGIIGTNGAGKSTLLKTIMGLVKPVEGKIEMNGIDITGWNPEKLKKLGIGFVPQELGHFPNMSVEENLKMGWWLNRANHGLRDRLEWIYNMFPNLKHKRNKAASMLSGGEIRMLDIARNIMLNPKLLLLDEPTATLSDTLAREVYKKLKMLKEEGTAIILVEQNIEVCINVSDYIYRMENGRIVFEGLPHDVRGFVKIFGPETLWE